MPVFLFLMVYTVSCVTKKDDAMEQQIKAQLTVIDSLLRSPDFNLSVAKAQDTAYYTGIGKPLPPFLTSAEESGMIIKSVKEEKIATNLAGFYALECGLNYLVTTKKLLPSAILHSITANTISAADKDLFSRFANATWKAGQPFRDLNRIERETFTPFYFLTDADIDKDWMQIKTAAAKVLTML